MHTDMMLVGPFGGSVWRSGQCGPGRGHVPERAKNLAKNPRSD